jgi:hypothetical protein
MWPRIKPWALMAEKSDRESIHYTLWATVGGVLVVLGSGSALPLVIWASGSPELHLWSHLVFDVAFGMSVASFILGVYVFVALATGRGPIGNRKDTVPLVGYVWSPHALTDDERLDKWLVEHRKRGLGIKHQVLNLRSTSSVLRLGVWWQVVGGSDVFVRWVLDLHHQIEVIRPSDLSRFQTGDEDQVLVYDRDEAKASDPQKAALFAHNLAALTDLLSDRGML